MDDVTPGQDQPREGWLARAGELYTAVICDVLDSLGHRGQAMEPGFVRTSGSGKLAGFAFPMRAARDERRIDGDPYVTQIQATDALSAGDVVVAATGRAACAFWGDLFSAAAAARGVKGAVIDGMVRDTERMSSAGFTTYSRGRSPVDSMQRLSVVDFGLPTEVGGVLVSPGDLVLADADGVVVIPAAAIEEALALSEEKVNKEDGMRGALERGALLADAWQEYRVL
jgi:regulator of RNase E activity RraA